jgi:transglutaminase-like putative cysteine protease
VRVRLTLTAALAVILASISVSPVLQGVVWFWAGAAAAVVAAACGLATRMPAPRSAAAGFVLAAVACWPMFSAPAPAWKAAGGVIVAATAGRLARPGVLRAPACLITYLSGLWIFLNLAFVPRAALGGVVPTTASAARLWHLAALGAAEHVYRPPVPEAAGAVLLAAAGIGAMAIITDIIAIHLRSPALAGLPLLTLYCVPITTSARQSAVSAAITFSLALIGYLALLAGDGRERFRVWGRLITVWQARGDEPGAHPDTRALAASGRRIGLAAACLAIVLPLLIPGLRVHSLFSGHGGAPGSGPSAGYASLPSPLVQLQDELRQATPVTILTYRTTNPRPEYQYLQVYVLNYDRSSGTWTLVPPSASTTVGSGQLRPVPGLSPDTASIISNTRITLSKHLHGTGSRFGFLPLPYAPTRLQIGPGWLEDDQTLMVYSGRAGLGGLSYTVASREADPAPDQAGLAGVVPRPIAAGYLGVPPEVSRALAALARRITRSARTPFQKAMALQSWFTAPGRFSYSLTARYPNTIAGLISFLTRGRTGYCQQFAFAMATLARLVGIPSRVAVGYTAGTLVSGNEWQVTSADAHAWPELYFPGAGWLRFEPTPGPSAGGQGTAVPPAYTQPSTTPGSGPGTSTQQPGTRPGPKASSGLGQNGHLRRLLANEGGLGTGPARSSGSDLGTVAWLTAVVVLGLALIAPMTIRFAARRRRWLLASTDAGRAEAAWREFTGDLADFRIACRASDSPRATGHRLAEQLALTGQPREALSRLVSAVERARYSAQPSPASGLREDIATIRQSVARAAGRRDRLRAVLLPPSAFSLLHEGWQRVLDAIGRADNAGLRFQVHLRRSITARSDKVWAGNG